MAEEAAIRIMYACQSGGLAHFSAFRGAMDFDIHPRLFTLRNFAPNACEEVSLPPFIVYGAGVDYKDEAWPDLAHLLEVGLYEDCVRLMCERLGATGVQALIMLPPENLAHDLYRPEGLTWGRTRRFNALWREAAAQYPCLAVLEIDRVCHPEELVDVNHLRPEALQTLATLVDVWYGYASDAPEGEWMEAA